MKRILLTCALMVGLVTMGLAAEVRDERASSTFTTKTRLVAIFKDGYGFFVREGTARPVNGWCSTNYIPNAVLGTFWLYSADPEDPIDTVVSTAANEVSFESPAQLYSALGDKKGLLLDVFTETAQFRGKLTHILEDMILLKSDSGTIAVKLADVKRVVLAEYPMRIHFSSGQSGEQTDISMGYLQAGINWLPTYVVDLLDDENASITLRATITNSAEDLSDCDVCFVVGVPNFNYKGQLDPLTIHRIAAFAMSEKFMDKDAASNVFRAQVAGGEVARELADMAEAKAPAEREHMTGAGFEAMSEFFFYERDDMTLAAGDVAMATVFTKNVKYESEYEWNADTKDVWHHVMIINDLDTPLTTGPMMTVRDGKPLGQMQFKFCPVGARGKASTTLATDVATEVIEVEVQRRPPETYSGKTFIPIEMSGTLTITNRRPQEIHIKVRRMVEGNEVEVLDGGKVLSTTTEKLNSRSVIGWELDIPARETETLRYTYVRYVEARTS